MATTPVSVDSGAAVYTLLSQLTNIGLQVGQIMQDVNSNHYRMLVQNNSGGTLTAAAGDALIWSSNSAKSVTTSSAIQQLVVGINDLSGQSVANGNYFWMTIRGDVAKVKTTGSPAANVILATTAIAGTLGAIGASVTQTTIVTTAAAVGATNTAYMY